MGARAGWSSLTAGESVPFLARKVSAHQLGGYLGFRVALYPMGKHPFRGRKEQYDQLSAFVL